MQLPTQAAVRDTPLGNGNELQENLLASLGIKGIQPQRQRWAPGLNKAFILLRLAVLLFVYSSRSSNLFMPKTCSS